MGFSIKIGLNDKNSKLLLEERHRQKSIDIDLELVELGTKAITVISQRPRELWHLEGIQNLSRNK